MTIITSLILLSLIIIIAAFNVAAISVHPKLLVVSYDAFRHDYFERNITPFMNKLWTEGTHSDYMMNLFVTKTFPNHYTMATGLFADTHGVVGNSVYDSDTGKPMPRNSYKMYHYNKDVAPFWIYNDMAGGGRHSGVMMWPGGHYDYLGMYPTFFQAFNASWKFETRVDQLISWFLDPETPINLGVLYIEDPDYHGHPLGINAPAFNQVLKKLDRLTKYLYDKLNENGLQDVNVVHVSDHGMQTITKQRIIDLNEFVNKSDYTIVDSSAGSHIFPAPGKTDLVYRQLAEGAKKNGHFRVYKKEEIPKEYHYGNNPRIGPIFIIPDIRYAFDDIRDSIKSWEKAFHFTSNDQSEFGVHGYDHKEKDMWAMFFAYGPIFKNHCKLEPFNNTDLFPLFCKILDLSNCPAVNGTLEKVKSCLEISFDENSFESIFAIGVLITVGIGVAVFIINSQRNRDRKTSYQRIVDSSNGASSAKNSKFRMMDTIWWIQNAKTRWIRGSSKPLLMTLRSILIKSKLWKQYGGEADKGTTEMHEQEIVLLKPADIY